jgi:hypothetical protein
MLNNQRVGFYHFWLHWLQQIDKKISVQCPSFKAFDTASVRLASFLDAATIASVRGAPGAAFKHHWQAKNIRKKPWNSWWVSTRIYQNLPARHL